VFTKNPCGFFSTKGANGKGIFPSSLIGAGCNPYQKKLPPRKKPATSGRDPSITSSTGFVRREFLLVKIENKKQKSLYKISDPFCALFTFVVPMSRLENEHTVRFSIR
jgi:hypothetical protein